MQPADDPPAPPQKSHFITSALLFEFSLSLVAVALGWLIGHDPLEAFRWSTASLATQGMAALYGILGAVPMLLCLVLVERIPGLGFPELKRVMNERVLPMFDRASVVELAALSVAAGWGEEILFRGLVQAGLAEWLGEPQGVWVALIVASLLFGICHWLTRTYAVLAALIGAYLGWLFMFSDNLLTPLVAHALYDFVALIYLLRLRPR